MELIVNHGTHYGSTHSMQQYLMKRNNHKFPEADLLDNVLESILLQKGVTPLRTQMKKLSIKITYIRKSKFLRNHN